MLPFLIGGLAMFYRDYEIDLFEVGKGQWHAKYRRRDGASTVIDGIEFESLHVGVAWSTNEAAAKHAYTVIDHLAISSSRGRS